MPFSEVDVAKHVAGLSPKQSAAWVKIANATVVKCQSENGTSCDASAIRIANSAAKNVSDTGIESFSEGLITTIEKMPWAAWSDIEPKPIDVRGDVISLVEKSVREDGTALIKVIKPGWGSSGFYSEGVLKRDLGKAFPKGTKMYWNHPTAAEEKDRPERDLRDLAAELVEDTRYDVNGADGPGGYARAKVFSAWRPIVAELAPHIGTSIRALGKATQGEAEGRRGPIIEELSTGRSVDFVTMAGAGGKVVELFESAHERILKEAGDVDEKDKKAYEAQIKEARDEASEARKAAEAAVTEGKKTTARLLMREAADFVVSALSKSRLPTVVREHIAREVIADVPLKDGAIDEEALTKRVDEAIKSETEYLAKITGAGTVRGVGPSTYKPEEDDKEPDLTEMYAGAFGLSESAAKVAAKGRGN